MNTDAKREYGLQPLDGLMTELELVNHDLVAASTEQLTHKMVSKGRKGRWLTMPVRRNPSELQQASGKTFPLSDLFTTN